MEETFFISSNKNLSFTSVVQFRPFNDQDGLPFPLYLNYYWRTALALSSLFTLIQGTKLRKIIISYILAPETKLGPINYLIMMDQLNGLMLGYIVMTRIVFIMSPVSVGSILSESFCKWNTFPGSAYIAGSCTWSFCIAVFRIVFVKGQHFLQTKMSSSMLLKGMICFGVLQCSSFSLLLVMLDDEVPVKQLCTHQSTLDIEIMTAYQVITF